MIAVSRLSLVIWIPLSLALTGQYLSEHTFDDVPVAEAPAGFTFESFRQPAPGRWTVERDGENGFLCHERDDAGGYSLAILDGSAPANLMMTARVRLTDGSRTGGLVWRYLNDQYYYSLVLDLERREISLVRVSGGHRIRVDAEDDLELDPEAWHTLKVVHVGKSVRASLGGIHVFDDEDRRSTWHDEPTRAGLIARGSSRVEFDDVRISARGDGR